MSLLEDRILRIVELKEQGLENLKIAEAMELSENSVERYYESIKINLSDRNFEFSPEYGLSILAFEFLKRHFSSCKKSYEKRSYKSKEERIKEIEHLKLEGKNLEQIAEITELSEGYLSQKFGLTKRRNKSKEERINQIKKFFEKFDYIEDLAKSVGLSIHYVYSLCLENDIENIKFRDNTNRYIHKKVKRNKLRDRLIRRGLTLEIIASKTGVSRERVRQYIVSTKQYDNWRESSEHYRNNTSYNRDDLEKKSIIASLINGVINNKKLEVSEQENFAFEKAIEWHEKVRITLNSYSFDNIYNLMMDYWEIKNKGKKKSIDKFGEENNLNFVSISRIFKTLELKTLVHINRKAKENLSFKQEEVIGKAYKVKMNCNDLSYFLKVPNYTIYLRFKKRKENRDEIDKNIIQFGKSIEGRLYYRTASQIYEAESAGFRKDETLELLSIDDKVYEHAINNKDKIGNFIINSLKVLYPQREIQNPWIN